MPYSAKAVANYFLDLAEAEGKGLTPMQLQKLVYFAHGWHLALAAEPLVDEHPEAWQYGPVFPSLYHEFKHFGAGPIKGRAQEWRLDINPRTGRRTRFHSTVPSMDDTSDSSKRDFSTGVVRRVWNVYGSWNGVQLSQMTHIADGPWQATRSANPDRVGSDIPDEEIRAFFRGKIAQPA